MPFAINIGLTKDGVVGTMHHGAREPLSPPVDIGRSTDAPQSAKPSQWSLKIQKQGAADFRSTTPNKAPKGSC